MQTGIHEFLDHLQRQMNVVGNEIFNTFFALSPVMEQSQSQR